MWNIEEWKKEIIDYAVEGIMNYNSISREDAIVYINKSTLEKSIKNAPDFIITLFTRAVSLCIVEIN